MYRKGLLIGALTLAFAAFGSAQGTVTVTPDDLHGWAPQTDGDGASTSFVTGPEGTPCGTGSLELAVGANGDNGAQFRNSNYDGTTLASLTELSYAVYVAQDGSGGQAPYLILNIDQNNDGTIDDLLFFEPVYQTGAYGGDVVPDQGVPVVGEWKTYNALVGGWWSLNAGTFGPPVTTIQSYLALYPDAVIKNSETGGGVRIVAGFGAGAWDNFVGNADCLTIGVSGTSTTFDFEVSGGGGEEPVFVDVNGDEEGTTTIEDQTLENGKTIQEMVDEAAANAKNHGGYVSAIAKLAKMLMDEEVITEAQRSELMQGAAQSQVGSKPKK
jgi:hypothetical protein